MVHFNFTKHAKTMTSSSAISFLHNGSYFAIEDIWRKNELQTCRQLFRWNGQEWLLVRTAGVYSDFIYSDSETIDCLRNFALSNY